MNEFDFIRRYLYRQQRDPAILLGVGDDAAVVRPNDGMDLCFSSDMLLKGRHFFADVHPADLAHKVLAVNISDMAAMGAEPKWVLLSAGVPELDSRWLDSFFNALFDLAGRFGVSLIGGDTVKGDLVFNVTAIGELPRGKALRRSAAKAGDDIWVSGQIGLAAAALQHHWGRVVLAADAVPLCEQARLRPEPRVALGRALLPLAHAAQDISDGLAQDLEHILYASGVGAEIFADELPTLPRLKACLPENKLYACMLAGGDDYELVFTAPPWRRSDVEEAGRASGTPVTRIGKINDTGRLKITVSDGLKEIRLDTMGFDHFG